MSACQCNTRFPSTLLLYLLLYKSGGGRLTARSTERRRTATVVRCRSIICGTARSNDCVIDRPSERPSGRRQQTAERTEDRRSSDRSSERTNRRRVTIDGATDRVTASDDHGPRSPNQLRSDESVQTSGWRQQTTLQKDDRRSSERANERTKGAGRRPTTDGVTDRTTALCNTHCGRRG